MKIKNLAFVIYFFSSLVFAQNYYHFNVNKIDLPLSSDGAIGNSVYGGSSATYNGSEFLFSGGFLLSGKLNDSLFGNGQATASVIKHYITGNVDSNQFDPKYNFYQTRFDNSFPLWDDFNFTWMQWKYAVELGAEYYDGDKNGIYEPVDLNGNGKWDSNEDRPDGIAKLNVWNVFNDGETRYDRGFNHVPLGIEIHQTVFGFNSFEIPNGSFLENVAFIRYKIFNTGKASEVLDSVYFTTYADTDVGDYTDDAGGSDSLLKISYVYNFYPDSKLGEKVPAHIVQILQTPAVDTPGETFLDNNSNGKYDSGIDTPLDTAYNRKGKFMGIEIFPGAKNAEIVSAVFPRKSAPTFGDPRNATQLRYFQLGLGPGGEEIDPCTFPFGRIFGNADCSKVNGKFWYNGDPETNTGWISQDMMDMKQLLTTGPFRLRKGEPVTIIYAYIMAEGSNYLNSVTVGKQHAQKVREFYLSNFEKVVVGVDEYFSEIPGGFQLYQNYPNPFNPITKIRFTVPNVETEFIPSLQLKVYDILGREVAALVNEEKASGMYEVKFDGSALSSGVYFYRLKAGEFISTKKMLLLR